MRNLERFWQSSILRKTPNALFPPNPSNAKENLTAESWSHPWTCLRRFPGRIHWVPQAFLACLFEVSTNLLQSSCGCTWINKKYFICKKKLWVGFAAIQLQKHQKNMISMKTDWKLAVSWLGNATNYGNFEGFVLENTINISSWFWWTYFSCMGLRPIDGQSKGEIEFWAVTPLILTDIYS